MYSQAFWNGSRNCNLWETCVSSVPNLWSARHLELSPGWAVAPLSSGLPGQLQTKPGATGVVLVFAAIGAQRDADAVVAHHPVTVLLEEPAKLLPLPVFVLGGEDSF